MFGIYYEHSELVVVLGIVNNCIFISVCKNV